MTEPITDFSLSTAWNYRSHNSASGILNEIKSLGFNSIELNFALTEDIVNDFIDLSKRGDVRITSTHNFCPLPPAVRQKDASPECYCLSSLNEEERRLAVKFTKRSLEFAKKLGAHTLVLHLGRVQIHDRTKELFSLMNTNSFEKEKEKTLNERDAQAKPFLNRAIESLKELLEYSKTIGVNVALENRYYIKELPSLEELKIIFQALPDKNLFYWHDTGHAQIYENLSILKHEDFLTSLSNRLIGVHLHDIIFFDDHRAPGFGEFDFKRLKPYLKKNVTRVIEAHRKASADEVSRSVLFLRSIFNHDA